MADCSEDRNRPLKSRKRKAKTPSTQFSKQNDESALASSNTLDTQANLQVSSSNTETSSSLLQSKRRRTRAPKTGTRTGLRSQSNISLEPQSTALASPTERAAERTSSTSSASTSRAAPTTSHVPATTSRATSRLSSSTSQALTSTASRRLTSAVASSTSASGSGSEPASRHSTRSRAAAAPKSAASLASSSSGESSRSSNITHSAADKSKGKERKARTTGTGGPSHSHPKLAGVRRATKVATTGDTNSKVKRTPGGVGSAHGERGESAAALPRLSQRNSAATRRRLANRDLAAGASASSAVGGAGAPGPSASAAASGSEAKEGEEAGTPGASGGGETNLAEMSSSSNNGNTGAGNSAEGSDDLPHVLHQLHGGLLGEVLRGSSSGAEGATGGSAGHDVDMARLQAMLEARGVPPHMFGSLESNMRNIIQRSMCSSAMNKVTSLIKGMQTKDDEGQQLSSVMEMCQILVMGNEENLAGFPSKQVVPELVALLHLEHNFDIMMYACRALYYMLEALPRSSIVVVEATPALLDKLKCIQCMDVAEQSLSALDRLSKRHNKHLLQSGAISACLMYIDFFSIDAQRYALAVAANCCSSVTPEEFHYCKDSLPLLSSKLLTPDKRCVESVCTCFARLVDNLKGDEKLLKELAAHEMLANTLKLLEVVPSVISSSIFTMVIRMFAVMCANCPDLAVCLLRQDVSNTLVYLLCGEQGASAHIELVNRTPQELFEIVSLIGELLPALPSTGLFAVDALLKKHPSVALHEEEVTWQWKDDKGCWKSYGAMDSRIIEAAYSASEEEVTISLSDMGRMYTIDFTMMQQINEDTGTARPVFRTTNSNLATAAAASADSSDLVKPDARAEVLAEQPELASSFIKSLFGILYEVYSSSAGPAIRHKCLQTLLRQIYYASPELLQEVLVNQPVSSHIASMLASQDHKVVVGALQMADILMRRLPETFTQYFQRQGVTHQIRNLSSSGVVASHCEGAATSNNSQPTAAPPDQTSGAVRPTDAASSRTVTSVISSVISSAISSAATTSGAPSASGASNPLPAGALTTGTSKSETGAIAKSKKTSKRIATRHSKSKSSLSENQSGDSSTSLPQVTKGKLSSKKSESSTAGSNSGAASTSNLTKLSKASFLATFNPTRWGKNTPSDKPPLADSRSVSTATLLANYREKVKSWITTHAKEFMNEHFSKLNPTAVKAEGVLLTLSKAANLLTGKDTKRSVEGDREALEMVAYTVADDDVSPFEMIHSGVIDTLTTYLHASPQVPSTSTALNDLSLPLEKRLAIFMNVFIGCPISPSTTYSQVAVSNEHRFAQLVSKTMACLHQQEQFQVKVHDLGLASGGGSANSNAMKFLSSHQLKCQLQRHPECKTFRAYSGGPVKVDPLAPVHAIENFLIRHGYCKPEGAAVSADIEIISDDEDGNSVDDLDDSMPGMLVDQRLGKHTIELVIGDRPLSYNQTVLQAIRNHATIDDSDHALGGSSVWSQTHVIWYRQATSEKSTGSAVSHSAPKKTKADGTNKSRKVKKTQDFFTDGVVSLRTCPLITSLSQTMAGRISVQDSCMQSVSLIRILYYINKYWGSLYQVLSYQPPVAESTFISSKLTAKANRQLQDPLVIMTGNIPQWLPQLAGSCPFLFPFETRHLLFYVNTFDRDRAMMRLQEANVDVSDMDTSGRVGPPRLEKRKKVVSRENIIKQAEHIFEDVGKSKSLLEFQYESEVGTGLGPTLEFYSLVSKELQATDLDIWHSPRNSESQADSTEYVDCKYGLYPKPLGRSAKLATVSKIKAKFRFIGKLLAKALMDSRILDLPMNPIIYSWLLGQQAVLTPSDLSSYDPSIAASYSHLQEMSAKVRTIQSDTNLKEEEKEKALLEVGVEDLCLDFTLPGYSNIRLKKGGGNESVNAENIDEYLQLLCHWIFHEGIYRQMEALKEGFDAIFPSSHLSNLFTSDEMEQLFCGNKSTKWDTKELFDCCRADHGYTMDSKALQNLFEILSSYDTEQQRKFLSFVTGSPRLPVGGFRSLNPQLTIVRKAFSASENPDDFLPSVMTCVNYLKLPDYSSVDIMRSKLDTAASIGQLSFHLS